jgi:aspartyl/asparaginyl-tRNA synthetase
MIDYSKIAIAVEHYKVRGYKYIEVPWLVSKESMLITAPPEVRFFSTFAGELVASGEQSFLQIRDQLLQADGFPALYQCVTPCFRDEANHDELHLQYFMKNELIGINWKTFNHKDKTEVPWALLNYLIRNALDFFKQYANHEDVKVVDAPMPNSVVNHDITIKGIEVGSYGYRYIDGFAWCYGTGCAEPRLSQVLAMK